MALYGYIVTELSLSRSAHWGGRTACWSVWKPCDFCYRRNYLEPHRHKNNGYGIIIIFWTTCCLQSFAMFLCSVCMWGRKRGGGGGREKERQRERQTDSRQTDRDIRTDRQTETERQGDRQAEAERQREKHTRQIKRNPTHQKTLKLTYCLYPPTITPQRKLSPERSET